MPTQMTLRQAKRLHRLTIEIERRLFRVIEATVHVKEIDQSERIFWAEQLRELTIARGELDLVVDLARNSFEETGAAHA